MGSTGAPTQLAGSPAASVYKNNSTTESTSGVTLTVDFDSRTGLNHVRITTSSDATFYDVDCNFAVVLTAGTVGGTSVVGYVVAQFSIENRKGIPDKLLKRDWTALASEASRSVLNALRALRNKINIDGSTLEIKKEDDTTNAWTAALTTTGGVDPITTIDPT